MSIILQTVITVIVVIALFSMANSLLLEGLRRWTKKRKHHLRNSIIQLFDVAEIGARDFATELFDHSFVKKLEQAEKGGGLTSMNADVFAEVFIQLICSSNKNELASKISLKKFEMGIDQLPKEIRAAVYQLFAYVEEESDHPLQALKSGVMSWYDTYMERVSMKFKRTTRMTLFLIGLVFAILLNLDLIEITNEMVKNEDLRLTFYNAGLQIANNEITIDTNAIVEYISDHATNLNGNDLLQHIAKSSKVGSGSDTFAITKGNSQLPIGWEKSDTGGNFLNRIWAQLSWWKVLGMIFMAGAMSFGAPFWFDQLKKMTKIDSFLSLKK